MGRRQRGRWRLRIDGEDHEFGEGSVLDLEF